MERDATFDGVIGIMDGNTDGYAEDRLYMESLVNFDGRAIGVGSCGDSLEITLRLRGEVIADIGCCPKGCEYTVACGRAVSSLALGRTLEQALNLQPEDVERVLGGLPEDHLHCARLAVNTLGEAIADTYRPPAGPKH